MKASDEKHVVGQRRGDFGVCQWFHFNDDDLLRQTVSLLKEAGVRHLRTGISWADFHRPGGREWYDRLMEGLRDFEVLLSIWHTPPSISEGGACSSPPKRLQDYADFIDTVITLYGDRFGALELWNEPNNRLKWNFREFDPKWRKFGTMIGMAAYWAKERGKLTVLGGMIPVDHHWLNLMKQYGVLEHIDVVAIHGFPGMWWVDAPNWDWHGHWKGWSKKVDYIQEHADGRPIWVTETGFATWNLKAEKEDYLEEQSKLLLEAAMAPAERIYWYCMVDLDPARPAIEGFHVDENEYHLGLIRHDGSRKPAFAALKQCQENRGERG